MDFSHGTYLARNASQGYKEKNIRTSYLPSCSDVELDEIANAMTDREGVAAYGHTFRNVNPVAETLKVLKPARVLGRTVTLVCLAASLVDNIVNGLEALFLAAPVVGAKKVSIKMSYGGKSYVFSGYAIGDINQILSAIASIGDLGLCIENVTIVTYSNVLALTQGAQDFVTYRIVFCAGGFKSVYSVISKPDSIGSLMTYLDGNIGRFFVAGKQCDAAWLA